MRITVLVAAALGAVALLTSDVGAATAPQVQPSAATSAPAAHTLDTQDADAFLDGFVPYALKSGDVAGAVIVVVKDGQVVTERGYGYADAAARRPVDPRATLFRPGSISKTFTWTAVMQLVEEGRIDLDADVNTYLDFKIPPHAGRPITMRDLLTHRPGFEEAYRDLIQNDPKRMKPLKDYLTSDMPARIYPAGEVVAYSNYGAALAGYIVQRVSGEPFDLYVKDHILAPLGMTRSSFSQPLPANLAAGMSRGYPVASQAPQPFELVVAAPAGALSTTGDDMAHFMIVHLQDGTYQGAQILKPQTARDMHAAHVLLSPPLPSAIGWGFAVGEVNGRPTFGHNGGTTLFFSNMLMFPTEKTGIFISANSEGKGGAGAQFQVDLLKDFADRYFPAASAQEPTWPSAKADARTVAGLYWPTRRADTNLFRIASLLEQAKVTALPDGNIQVSSLTNSAGAVITWREIGPFVWRETGGGDRRIAATVKGGKVQWLTSGWLQPVPETLKASWNVPLLIASAALLVLVVLSWPLSILARRKYGSSFGLSGREAQLYRLTRLTALADIVCLGCWGAVLATASSDATKLNPGLDPLIRATQVFGLLGLVGAAIALLNLIAVWRGPRGWFAKLSSLLIAVAILDVAWIVLNFHLLTFSTRF